MYKDLEKEYIKAGGTQCPFCKSSSITGKGFETDGGDVWQEIECEACGMSWLDCYVLKGIEAICR